VQDVMKLKAAFKSRPVEITDEQGQVRRYTLRELDGKQRDQWFSLMGDRVQIEDGRVVGVRNFDGFQAALVSHCLYDEKGQAVPIDEIQALPARVQDALFRAAQELSALTEQSVADAKND